MSTRLEVCVASNHSDLLQDSWQYVSEAPEPAPQSWLHALAPSELFPGHMQPRHFGFMLYEIKNLRVSCETVRQVVFFV